MDDVSANMQPTHICNTIRLFRYTLVSLGYKSHISQADKYKPRKFAGGGVVVVLAISRLIRKPQPPFRQLRRLAPPFASVFVLLY